MHGKGRPFAQLAFNRYAPAHHVANSLADGKPKPGPRNRVIARGFDLNEIVEKIGQCFSSMPMPVSEMSMISQSPFSWFVS